MAEDKTVTVESHGVKIQFDPTRFDDARVALIFSTLVDESVKDSDKMLASSKLFKIIFGDDCMRIMDELADANGGRISNADFSDFMMDCIKAANAKN